MAKIDITYHNLLNKILQEGYTYEDPNRKGVNRLEILSYTFRHEFKDGFPAITTKKLNYNAVATELIWFLRGDTNIKYLVDNDCNIWNKDAYNYYIKQFNPEDRDTMPMSIERFIELVKDHRVYEKSRVESNNYKLGDLGPIYGNQWRKAKGFKNDGISIKTYVDQIQRLIKNLKEKPLATDHIVNAWNVGDLKDMALPPCHYGFQIVVRPLTNNERVLIWKNKNSNGFAGFISEDVINIINKENITKYGFELHWQQRSVDTFLG